MTTYIPNATLATEPTEDRTVESAALEFRTLKGSVNARIVAVQSELDATQSQLAAERLQYLRVPESSASPLAAVAARAGKLLAFDELGQPTAALPVADSSTGLRLDLASTTGASLVGYDGGTVQDVLDKTAETFRAVAYPEWYGAVCDAAFNPVTNTLTGTDDRIAIQAALDDLMDQGGGKLVISKPAVISGEIAFSGNFAGLAKLEIEFLPGACLYAADSFTGTRMIRVGTPTGGTGPENRTNHWSIRGGRVCHTRGIAGVGGIEVTRGRFGVIDAQTVGAKTKGIWVGSSAAASSGDIHLSDRCAAYWWDTDVAPPSIDNAGSIGIFVDSANDCTIGDISAIGYRRGVVVNGSSIKFTGSVHPWTYMADGLMGPMQTGLEVTGSLNLFSDVYADTPTSGGDSAIAAAGVSGMKLGGFNNVVLNYTCFLNQVGGARDNEVDSVTFSQSGSQNTIVRAGHQSNNAGVRFKTHYSGNGPDSDTSVSVLTHHDDFRVVDTSKRNNYFGGRPSLFTTALIAQATIETLGAATFRGTVRQRGPAGTTRFFEYASDGSLRCAAGLSSGAESGSDAGSDWTVNTYSDGGAYKATPLTVRRSDGRVEIGQAGGTGVRLRLNTGTETTVGAAGGASALPATPLGYAQVNINGAIVKIPYYN